MYYNSVIVNLPVLHSIHLVSFRGRGRLYDLLFNVGVVKLLFKRQWGIHRTPHFIFVFWSALVIGK